MRTISVLLCEEGQEAGGRNDARDAEHEGQEINGHHHGQGGGYDLRLDERPRCGANCSRVLWEADGHYSTHLFTQRAEVVIARTPARTPLFIYLAYQAVHCPAQAPAHYVARYHFASKARNIFAGMLSALDEGIANVTQALRAARRCILHTMTSAPTGKPTT